VETQSELDSTVEAVEGSDSENTSHDNIQGASDLDVDMDMSLNDLEDFLSEEAASASSQNATRKSAADPIESLPDLPDIDEWLDNPAADQSLLDELDSTTFDELLDGLDQAASEEKEQQSDAASSRESEKETTASKQDSESKEALDVDIDAMLQTPDKQSADVTSQFEKDIEQDLDIQSMIDDSQVSEQALSDEIELNLDMPIDEYQEITGEITPMDVDQDDTGGSAKLDLARAYLEMHDHKAARKLLQEVLKIGNDTQQQEAQGLLDSIEN
jgi:pilus assembly protein FimV